MQACGIHTVVEVIAQTSSHGEHVLQSVTMRTLLTCLGCCCTQHCKCSSTKASTSAVESLYCHAVSFYNTAAAAAAAAAAFCCYSNP
jgi:hypothetical protein